MVVMCVLFAMSACSSQYAVTIDSTPTGADVSCNGESYGYAPVTLYFELDEATKESGYLRTCQLGLKWVSGATAIVNNVHNLNKFPNGVISTIPRPNVSGYSQDVEFALKVKNMRQQKRQYQAAVLDNLNQSLQQQTNSLQQQLNSKSYSQPSFNDNNNRNYGTPVYNASDCKGSVVNGKCYGAVVPSGVQKKCYGTMLNGECIGTVSY